MLITSKLKVNTEVNIFRQRSTALIAKDLKVNINDNEDSLLPGKLVGHARG